MINLRASLFAFSIVTFIFTGCLTTTVVQEEREPIAPTIAKTVDDLLAEGEQINLMVVLPLENISFMSFDGGSIDPRWFEDTQKRAIAVYEQYFLANNPPARVSVISESSIELALEQMEIQASGLTDSETAARVGRFVGANYLVELSASRYMSTRSKYTESTIRKFIEVESSRILAIDKYEAFYTVTDSQPELVSLELNGRDYYKAEDGEYYYN